MGCILHIGVGGAGGFARHMLDRHTSLLRAITGLKTSLPQMTVLHKLLILVFKCTCNSLQVHYICNSDHGKQTLPLFILESDQGGQ